MDNRTFLNILIQIIVVKIKAISISTTSKLAVLITYSKDILLGVM